jgi:predicted acylesterase/phospholipase RssA
VNSFKAIDISYKTHPDWRVIDAAYCSSTLPIIFAPYIRDNQCFVDGGVICSYPIKQCLDDGHLPDEIFAIKKHTSSSIDMVTDQSSLFDYLMIILRKTIRVLNGQEIGLVPNEILVSGDSVSIDGILTMSASKEARSELIEFGKQLFTQWQILP